MPLPESIAHYRVVSKLGEGGMGAVYRATDTKLNRDVAVKVLPAAFAADEGRLQRFAREAQVLASLNHPNIASIYGVEERALVMELVEGRPPAGPLPLETVLDYARQMAEALEYAHEKGIVHRDLKPANILVTADGAVKLLDFGLAKAMAGEPGPGGTGANSPTLTMGATEVGVILGTAGYMAPEQARGKAVDRRADIWAFGVILWELLTGKPMFAGENASDILGEVLTKEPDLGVIPERMRRLVGSCLQKDPRVRLKSIGDWRLLVGEERRPERARTRSWVPWAVAGALAVCLAGVVRLGKVEGGSPPNYHLQVTLPEGTTVLQDSLSDTGAISPDGQKIAFIGETAGKRQIWVRALDHAMARMYPGTELAEGLFWAPDGNRLGFLTGSALKTLDLSTGAVTRIAAIPFSNRGGSWGPDGNILYATTAEGIMMVPSVGGRPIPVTVFDRETESSQFWPQWLPDGRHFLYFLRKANPAETGIYIGSIESMPERAEKRLLLASQHMGYHAENHLLFRNGTNLLAQPFEPAAAKLTGNPVPVAEIASWRDVVTASRGGVLAITPREPDTKTVAVVDRGGKLLQLVGEPGQYMELRLSPDNRSCAIVRRAADSFSLGIWLMNLASGIPTLFTGESTLDLHPVWSSNGTELFFGSAREGGYRMFRKPIIGDGKARRVTTTQEVQLPSDVSSDGRLMAIYSRRKSEDYEAALLPLTGGESLIRLGGEWARISPDGRWVAIDSRETGEYEVYVQAMPGPNGETSPKIRVSRTGGLLPAWSSDGSELYFHTPAHKLMAAKVTAKGGQFATQEPQELFALGGSSYYHGATFWEPMGKGDRFVVLRSAPSPPRAGRIELLLNWKAAMGEGK